MNPDFWRRPPETRWQRVRTVTRNLLVLAIFASPAIVNLTFPEFSNVFAWIAFWLCLGIVGWTVLNEIAKWRKQKAALRRARHEREQDEKRKAEAREAERAARQRARADRQAQQAAAFSEVASWAGLSDADVARLATRFELPSAVPLDTATAASLGRILLRWRTEGKTPEWVRANVTKPANNPSDAMMSDDAPHPPADAPVAAQGRAAAGTPHIDIARLLAPPMNEDLFEQSWWNEGGPGWRHRNWDDERTAQCAMLPEGMEHMEHRRHKDRRFQEKYETWRAFVNDHQLELLIEQSTDEAGRLLPHELRMMRTYTAPEEWRCAMRELLVAVPKHVLAYLLLWVSMEVRIERARRTGSAHWRPHEADPPEPEPAFRASKFKPRNYAR